MKPRRRRDRFWLRLNWRVPVGVALYLLPTFLPMDEKMTVMLRDTGMGVVIAAFASWMATQGRRRPGRERTTPDVLDD